MGKKIWINGPGHMTKMAAMVKTSKIFSYRTNSPLIMKLGMGHYVIKLYKVYIDDDPELTMTYFTTMTNLAKLSRLCYQVSVYKTTGPMI